MTARKLTLTISFGLLAALTGCRASLLQDTGQGPDSGTGSGGMIGNPILETFACDREVAPDTPPRLWRLTGSQFRSSVEAFIAGRRSGERSPPPYEGPIPFEVLDDSARFSTTSATYAMTAFDFTGAVTASEAAARAASATRCEGVEDFGSCARSELEQRAPIALRRPLTPEELDQYAGVAAAAEPVLGAAEALTLAFEAVLLGPEHLFRAELGRGEDLGGGLRQLSAYEVAHALSFSLTDEPPSAETLALAADGSILDEAVLAAEILRLAKSPRFVEKAVRFVEEYYHFGAATEVFKDPAASEGHDPYGLVDDTRAWVRHLIETKGQEGFLVALYSEPSGFVSPTTAATYGVPAPAERTLVSFDPAERAGILSQPSWLVAFSHMAENKPVERGHFIYEEVLCEKGAKEPPANVPPLRDLGPDATLREKLAEHTGNPKCAGCHQLMDPIGLGFESYDHLGVFRTTEVGRPVDASGSVPEASDVAGPFTGAPELGEKIAGSEKAALCFLAHSFEFWLGRKASKSDGCSLVDARESSDDASVGEQSFVAWFLSRSFLERRLETK